MTTKERLFVLAGAAWGSMLYCMAEAQTPARPKALEVRELVIRDDAGRERIEIAVRNRTAAIVFYDAKHVETMRLMSMDRGGAAISFPDRRGEVLANIGLTPDGEASVSLGRRGQNRVGIVAADGGNAGIVMTDREGEPQYTVGLDAAGQLQK